MYVTILLRLNPQASAKGIYWHIEVCINKLPGISPYNEFTGFGLALVDQMMYR